MAAALRTTASRIAGSASSSSSRAFVHTRVPLPYDLNAGLAPFLKEEALKTIAVDWQEGLLTKLNELVKGTPYENMSVYQTVKQTAQDPTHALTFNYASEALNNSFFLSTLTPTPTQLSPHSSFSQSLRHSPFGSFGGLVSHLSAHASGLHPSSGAYVWLTSDQEGRLGVLGTYTGGTLIIQGARRAGRAQASDAVLGEIIPPPTTEDAEASSSTSGWKDASSFPVPVTSGLLDSTAPDSLLRHTRGSSLGFAGRDVGKSIHPLVCISMHPHCYLEQYGVWGREEYVKNWWSAVNWTEVEHVYDQLVTKAKPQ